MKIVIKTLVLTGSLLISASTMSQSLSLNEYYSDYLTAENSNTLVTEQKLDNVAATDKLSLSEYYAEYIK